MKRDMNLVRSILLDVEKNKDNSKPRLVLIHGHSYSEVRYHIRIMVDAGLVTISPPSELGTFPKFPPYITIRMTWDGHKFLDAACKDTHWEKAKQKTLDKTGGFSLELFKMVLFGLTKKSLGL